MFSSYHFSVEVSGNETKKTVMIRTAPKARSLSLVVSKIDHWVSPGDSLIVRSRIHANQLELNDASPVSFTHLRLMPVVIERIFNLRDFSVGVSDTTFTETHLDAWGHAIRNVIDSTTNRGVMKYCELEDLDSAKLGGVWISQEMIMRGGIVDMFGKTYEIVSYEKGNPDLPGCAIKVVASPFFVFSARNALQVA
jgi:hypothetical protein